MPTVDQYNKWLAATSGGDPDKRAKNQLAFEREDADRKDRLARYLQDTKGDQAASAIDQKSANRIAELEAQLKALTGDPGLANASSHGRAVRAGGVSIGATPQARGLDSNEANKVLSRESKVLGKGEEALGAIDKGDAFLQNPNAYNLPDLKALSVVMQGFPARAMGAEMKTSGFEPQAWNKALKEIQLYADDPKGNPLTPETLDVFRKNYGVMRASAVKKFDADKGRFWGSEAPALGKHMDSGTMDNLRTSYDKSITDAHGDYHKAPWDSQGPGAAGQVAPATVPPANKGVFGKLQGFLKPGGTQSPPGIGSAPAQAQPPQGQSQMPPGQQGPNLDPAAAKAAFQQQWLQQNAPHLLPQQQPSQGGSSNGQ